MATCVLHGLLNQSIEIRSEPYHSNVVTVNHIISMCIKIMLIAVVSCLKCSPMPYLRNIVISALYGTSCITWFTHLQPSIRANLWSRRESSQREEERATQSGEIYLSVCLKSGGPLFLSRCQVTRYLTEGIIYLVISASEWIPTTTRTGPGTISVAWRMALAWAYCQGLLCFRSEKNIITYVKSVKAAI